jgi:chemotaxis protein CheZ
MEQNSNEPAWPTEEEMRAEEAMMRAAAEEQAANNPPEVFSRLGNITRQLHDALKELGFAEKLQGTVGELPDAQSRLNYIARLTGEAADKVLNSVDEAKAKQAQIVQVSKLLADLFPAKPALAEQLMKINQLGEQSDQHLTDIMMAQDFHDLTGQVINRVVKLAASIEEQLLQLLVDVAPEPVANRMPSDPMDLSGPVVNPEGRSDVAASQQDVDDLLASLGF